MNGHCINIAISGLGLKSSDELKLQLRNIIPDHYSIKWTSIADVYIDLLFVNEHFFESTTIQRILKKKSIPFLKIAKNKNLDGKLIDNTLYLSPGNQSTHLEQWINIQFLTHLFQPIPKEINHDVFPKNSSHLKATSFKNMHDSANARLHLFDNQGTLAIIDTRIKVAWLEPTRQRTYTDHSFQYNFATTGDFIKVSRKIEYQLEDWLWNLVWESSELSSLAYGIDHYKLHFWPQPLFGENRKVILQLSACFIQGANLNEVANQLKIPLSTVQQFIAASIASNNGKEISSPESRFMDQKDSSNKEQQGILIKFFEKLRHRFGL